MPTVIANRYARALADVVAPAGNYRQVLGELEEFGVAYRESLELREVCDTPAISMEQKLNVLAALAARMDSSHVTLNFLRVLMSHYRMSMLDEAIQAFRNIVNERLGIVRVRISSASNLSHEEQTLLQARFNELTHKQSELEFHLDAGLIGGLVAQIGSTVFDGSIRGSLDRLRGQLLAQ
jgi:F-type H+-transporting ATPase subunit delta